MRHYPRRTSGRDGRNRQIEEKAMPENRHVVNAPVILSCGRRYAAGLWSGTHPG
jgi:hypothetical protein